MATAAQRLLPFALRSKKEKRRDVDDDGHDLINSQFDSSSAYSMEFASSLSSSRRGPTKPQSMPAIYKGSTKQTSSSISTNEVSARRRKPASMLSLSATPRTRRGRTYSGTMSATSRISGMTFEPAAPVSIPSSRKRVSRGISRLLWSATGKNLPSNKQKSINTTTSSKPMKPKSWRAMIPGQQKQKQKTKQERPSRTSTRRVNANRRSAEPDSKHDRKPPLHRHARSHSEVTAIEAAWTGHKSFAATTRSFRPVIKKESLVQVSYFDDSESSDDDDDYDIRAYQRGSLTDLRDPGRSHLNRLLPCHSDDDDLQQENDKPDMGVSPGMASEEQRDPEVPKEIDILVATREIVQDTKVIDARGTPSRIYAYKDLLPPPSPLHSPPQIMMKHVSSPDISDRGNNSQPRHYSLPAIIRMPDLRSTITNEFKQPSSNRSVPSPPNTPVATRRKTEGDLGLPSLIIPRPLSPSASNHQISAMAVSQVDEAKRLVRAILGDPKVELNDDTMLQAVQEFAKLKRQAVSAGGDSGSSTDTDVTQSDSDGTAGSPPSKASARRNESGAGDSAIAASDAQRAVAPHGVDVHAGSSDAKAVHRDHGGSLHTSASAALAGLGSSEHQDHDPHAARRLRHLHERQIEEALAKVRLLEDAILRQSRCPGEIFYDCVDDQVPNKDSEGAEQKKCATGASIARNTNQNEVTDNEKEDQEASECSMIHSLNSSVDDLDGIGDSDKDQPTDVRLIMQRNHYQAVVETLQRRLSTSHNLLNEYRHKVGPLDSVRALSHASSLKNSINPLATPDVPDSAKAANRVIDGLRAELEAHKKAAERALQAQTELLAERDRLRAELTAKE